MSSYSLSYSTLADVWACAEEAREAGNTEEAQELEQCALDLERAGVGWYAGTEFQLHYGNYGVEVLSLEDWEHEEEEQGSLRCWA